VKSYAFDLLDWLRFLAAVVVGWEQAGRPPVETTASSLQASGSEP
jgi:hypothetical protein